MFLFSINISYRFCNLFCKYVHWSSYNCKDCLVVQFNLLNKVLLLVYYRLTCSLQYYCSGKTVTTLGGLLEDDLCGGGRP